ncbi:MULTISPECIES: Scr1 family TA system antitoxin-like transcriptional regulator [Actinomycetes]|uniref:Scr1 family TA system antitoxin-like transcriptional regulator n=1 Tax=Streptomyces acidiscabies TaxID=42234 RepID=A0AAP6EL08_9ACTN|nr:MULTISPECIES: Scr1 family TA system antitoxin-like transcriptional regulator [Actinomycetes]MDX2966155.1 Scr1 family TA system antitoxin-like transcriptional regulator [Streptomyces acidiscabies]MDX3007095.1 Scr1 family TA system antitoxin-like transcriptional regulator [Kribbella solani]MDX3025576.1 Scr1 family TA system antitoxin-like transcriptional regulator [Streptomyces acidiscabies]MDX3796147.1 Scr1 family TA system antitoxin-like transcriptional regulator [Streptomyces acidiscabies]
MSDPRRTGIGSQHPGAGTTQEASINSALHDPFGILAFPEPVETDVVYADGLIDTVHYEEPAQVEIFTTLFRRLNSEALPADESMARIRLAIQEMEEDS